MRDQMIKALRQYAQGNLDMHRATAEVYLTNPVGIGEHPQVMEELTEQLKRMAEWDDVLDIIDNYFDE